LNTSFEDLISRKWGPATFKGPKMPSAKLTNLSKLVSHIQNGVLIDMFGQHLEVVIIFFSKFSKA